MSLAADVKLVLDDIIAKLDLKAAISYVDTQISNLSGLFATAAQGTKADNALPASSYTAADILTKLKTVDGAGSGLDSDLLDGLSSAAFATAAQGTKADNALPASSYTAADILTKIKTVDGSGSGLDADLLDGLSYQSIILGCFPIGSIYLSVVSTNPSGLFGGTWVQIGQGRTLFGQDGTDTRFDAPEETGGTEEHTHTSAGHTHGGGGLAALINIATTGATYIAKKTFSWTGNPSTRGGTGNYGTVSGDSNSTAVIIGGSTDSTTPGNTGSTSHIPPYLVVYMWKRTA